MVTYGLLEQAEETGKEQNCSSSPISRSYFGFMNMTNLSLEKIFTDKF
jgi:hypothetical protein